MDLPHRRKAALFERVLGALGEHFTLVPMGEHAAAIEARRNLPARVPVLAA